MKNDINILKSFINQVDFNYKNKNVAIYGAGTIGEEIYTRKHKQFIENRCKLKCYIDQYSHKEKLFDIPILKLKEVQGQNVEIIIISVLNEESVQIIREQIENELGKNIEIISIFNILKLIYKQNLKEIVEQKYSLNIPIKIIIGSGIDYYTPNLEDEWIFTDLDTLNICNLNEWDYFFSEKMIDSILAEHVMEHLDITEINKVLLNCYSYLNQNGRIRIAVPDGYHKDECYIEYVKPGGFGTGSDTHKVLLTYDVLENELKKVGFEVEYIEYYDEHKEFHSNSYNEKYGRITRDSKAVDSKRILVTGEVFEYTSLILDGIKRTL